MALSSLDSGWDFPAEAVRRPPPEATPDAQVVVDDGSGDGDTDAEVDAALAALDARDPTTPSRPSSLGVSDSQPAGVTPAAPDDASGDARAPEQDVNDMMFGAIEQLLDSEPQPTSDAAERAVTQRLEIIAGTPMPAAEARHGDAAARSAPAVVLGRSGEDEGFSGPDALLDALASPDRDLALRARAELLLAGEGALAALLARFPGPIRSPWPGPASNQSVGYSGPLLAAVIELGSRFQRQLWTLMQSGNRDQRYYVVARCREIRNPRVNALGDRLFDSDAGIRQLACDVLQPITTASTSSIAGCAEPDARRYVPARRLPARWASQRRRGHSFLIELVDHKSADVAQASISARRLVYDSLGGTKRSG
jgi:hypothetical protein